MFKAKKSSYAQIFADMQLNSLGDKVMMKNAGTDHQTFSKFNLMQVKTVKFTIIND